MKVDVFKWLNGFPTFICTGDFAFDNAILHVDPPLKVVFDMEILGDRWLRGTSLSHGILPTNSPERKRSVRQVEDMLASIQKDPSIENVRKFGGYDKPIPIEKVC